MREKSSLSRPYNWLIHHYTITAIKRHAPKITGRVLDVGCGTRPYQAIIEQYCDYYLGGDYPPRAHQMERVDVGMDAHHLPYKSSSFDGLVCFQVLEHLRQPWDFLTEALRVLKPGGYFLLTTPFMWGEHEQPNDYYRYTRFGLQHLAEKTGFEVVSIEADTGYWATAVLQFNYWLRRFHRWIVLIPIVRLLWLNQYLVFWLSRYDRDTAYTATFTTLLRKKI